MSVQHVNCIVLTCDICGESVQDPDNGPYHFETAKSAKHMAKEMQWEHTEHGDVCVSCVDEGSELAAPPPSSRGTLRLVTDDAPDDAA